MVDDGSSDETENIVRAFTDPRITYLRREINGGVAAANNTAIRAAQGQYISFLGDDDEFLPDFLTETWKIFESSPEAVGFVWSGVRFVRDTLKGEALEAEKIWNSDAKDKRRAIGIGTGYGLTIRHTCFDIVGLFDETLRSAVDAEFLMRLVRSFEFAVLSQILVKVHNHSNMRVTQQLGERGHAFEKIIQENQDLLRQYPDLWAVYHRKAGLAYYGTNNYPKARKMMLQALARNPVDWKTWKGALVYEIFGNGWLRHLIRTLKR